MANLKPENTNTFVEKQLDLHIDDMQTELNADVLSFLGPLLRTIDDFIRDAVED